MVVEVGCITLYPAGQLYIEHVGKQQFELVIKKVIIIFYLIIL